MSKKAIYPFAVAAIAIVAVVIATFFMTSVGAQKAHAGENGAFLGVYPRNITDDDRDALEFKGKDGVMIDGVIDDGPSDEAGMESGDIIIKMGGDPISNTKDMRKHLKKLSPGDDLKVLVFRGGKEKELNIKLGERPDDTFSKSFKMYIDDEDGGFLGVETIGVDDDLAEYFGVKSGALIRSVVDDSPAEKAGLKAGDVITKVGDDDITSKSDLIHSIRSHKPEEEVSIQYYRKENKMTAKVTLDEAESDCHVYKFNKNFVFDTDDFRVSGEHLKKCLESLTIPELPDMEDLDEELEELREEIEKIKNQIKEMQKQSK